MLELHDAIFVYDVTIINPLPYSLEYTEDQRNRWGSEQEAIFVSQLAVTILSGQDFPD